MKQFAHYHASSEAEACSLLARYEGRAKVIAGGSDLVTVLRADILPSYPEAVINLKSVPGLDDIREEEAYLYIGAMTTLDTLGKSEVICQKYPALAQAARAVASPQIRNVGTLGGNLCQDTRCWYYRYPDRLGGGSVECPRKGKGGCLAPRGDHRYHAIMGVKGCFAVCPSDTAVALTALKAEIVISGAETERCIPIDEFFHPMGNVLKNDEIVREIRIPTKNAGCSQSFIKHAQREAIDFAIASAAAVLTVTDGVVTAAALALGAVAPTPVNAKEAADRLVGRPIGEAVLNEVADAALAGARPMKQNRYKVSLCKNLLKRAIIEAAKAAE